MKTLTQFMAEAYTPRFDGDNKSWAGYQVHHTSSMPLNMLHKIHAGFKTKQSRVDHWKNKIQKGETVPPVIVTHSDETHGKYEILDGHHRHEAFKQLGHKEAPVVIVS